MDEACVVWSVHAAERSQILQHYVPLDDIRYKHANVWAYFAVVCGSASNKYNITTYIRIQKNGLTKALMCQL